MSKEIVARSPFLHQPAHSNVLPAPPPILPHPPIRICTMLACYHKIIKRLFTDYHSRCSRHNSMLLQHSATKNQYSTKYEHVKVHTVYRFACFLNLYILQADFHSKVLYKHITVHLMYNSLAFIAFFHI